VASETKSVSPIYLFVFKISASNEERTGSQGAGFDSRTKKHTLQPTMTILSQTHYAFSLCFALFG
jgi:hypothetical protein